MSVSATVESQPAGPASQGTDVSAPGRTGATNAQAPATDPTTIPGAESEEQPVKGIDYFRQAFSRIRPYTQGTPETREIQPATASNPTAQAPGVFPGSVPEGSGSVAQGQPAPAAQPATTLPQQRPQAQPAPDTRIVLTPEEHRRAVQAEADRLLAEKARKEKEAADRAREVELRRTNPFEYANLMEAKEQELQAAQKETERLSGVLKDQLFHYDRNVLDIMVSALPESDRDKVIAKNIPGIEGRKATAENTIKALRTRWLAEGRASAKADLMKDQTFIKEVLARYGQAAPEPEVSPVQARPASSTGRAENGHEAVNAWMRGAARSVRTGVGN